MNDDNHSLSGILPFSRVFDCMNNELKKMEVKKTLDLAVGPYQLLFAGISRTTGSLHVLNVNSDPEIRMAAKAVADQVGIEVKEWLSWDIKGVADQESYVGLEDQLTLLYSGSNLVIRSVNYDEFIMPQLRRGFEQMTSLLKEAKALCRPDSLAQVPLSDNSMISTRIHP